MKVRIASDHAGCQMKDQLAEKLRKEGYEVELFGATSGDTPVSYAEVGIEFAKTYINDKDKNENKYIAICGSGIGISIALNRFKKIRCARVDTPEEARLAKLHNDANVLCFGGRLTSVDDAMEMFHQWNDTTYEGNRHVLRVAQLSSVGEDVSEEE
ncbi:Ribose-5-phosphate isomerase B (Phosphoriboisomerase B) [Metamycoplasma cloacale]|uniref:RpiB/LacA/LacB family sugar-phosphate isomerase n=1 Tax=Metamycoplasma cloacale TaxID=92401 RepID=A0A2Z4LLE8_9BACT|nr:RpiB/LacA/LacB family sugar-phosphate isomerase [Metamycoplasma cloacale]AWX42505.1 RpiB/LacA/LacB family sugar-phosphate isomerase [Metamycoplasma cloacale]VEU79149.1 Ribose-5-phosphate isomerase B (Phosphoriboisomerase B) [Metamycoplasma cloacale]